MSEFNYTDGINLLEAGAAAAALTAIFGLLFLMYDRGVKPVVKASKEFNRRWGDAGEIDQIQADLKQVMEALKPTNGDKRTLSERVDVIKHAAIEAQNVAIEVRSAFDMYKREEAIDRRARMREAAEEKRALNLRIESVEGRQNDMSSRQTNMEAQLNEILRVVRDTRTQHG